MLTTLEFPRGKDRADPKAEVIRFAIDEYNGHDFVSVRVWFRTDSGEYRPSPRGISVRARELHQVAEWFADAAKEIGEEPRAPKRERLPASTMGAGPELSPEEEAGLF